jgi:hypothetical protein
MATGIWVKQGTVIPAVSADTPGQPNVLFETGAQILSGTVFKCWFGTTNGICYAESTDGLSWTRYVSNPVINKTNFANNYAYPRVYKNGATYYMFVGPLNGPIQVWTSTDGLAWSVQNATAISQGSAGQWDNPRCTQLNVLALVGSTWYGYYTGTTNENTVGWRMGLATSPNLITWTKGGSNPVITYEGPSNFCWAQVGSVYYGWSQITLPGIPGNSSPQLPSDIMRFYATNPAGPWTPLSTSTMYRTTLSEGMANAGGAWNFSGQVADPTLVQAGADLWMFYTLDASGGGWVIGAAKAASTTIAQIVTGYEGVSNIPIPWNNNSTAPLQLATQATDSFTRADENPIAGNWTQVSSLSGFGQAQLSGNQVMATVAGTRASYYWNAQAWNADQWASIKVTVCTAVSNVGISLRNSTSGAATCYMCLFLGTLGTPGTIRIQKFVTGTFTSLYSASTFTLNANDIITGSVIGTQISMYVNGALVLNGTDASIASGAAGWVVNGITLNTNAAIDDWTGGNISTPTPIPTPSASGFGTQGDMLTVNRWCTRMWP